MYTEAEASADNPHGVNLITMRLLLLLSGALKFQTICFKHLFHIDFSRFYSEEARAEKLRKSEEMVKAPISKFQK